MEREKHIDVVFMSFLICYFMARLKKLNVVHGNFEHISYFIGTNIDIFNVIVKSKTQYISFWDFLSYTNFIYSLKKTNKNTKC